MESIYDIAVIGMGPAGSIFAKYIDTRYKTVVIDKKSGSAQGFKKPCGGLLAPDAQKTLSKFGLGLPSFCLETPQIFAVKTIDINEKLTRYYQRFYLNLSRERFDSWLMSGAGEHVEVLKETVCLSIQKKEGYFCIKLRNKENTYFIKAKNIIGADGSNSVVRKTFFTRDIRCYICLQQYFKITKAEPYFTCIFDKTLTDCYGWINVKGGRLLIGAAFPSDNAGNRFKAYKNVIQDLGYDLSSPESKPEGCLVSRPKTLREIVTGNGSGIFLIGEAAGFVSPSSLEGISYSMHSAYMLAKAFNSGGNADKNYKRLIKSLRFKIFIRILKTPFIYNPVLRKLVMKSGLEAIDIY